MGPCTPHGIMELFNRYGTPLFDQHVPVVDSSRTLGLPLSHEYMRRLASVQVCNEHTPDLLATVREADPVFACAGHRNAVKAYWLREHAVVGGTHSQGEVTARDDFVPRKLVALASFSRPTSACGQAAGEERRKPAQKDRQPTESDSLAQGRMGLRVYRHGSIRGACRAVLWTDCEHGVAPVDRQLARRGSNQRRDDQAAHGE